MGVVKARLSALIGRLLSVEGVVYAASRFGVAGILLLISWKALSLPNGESAAKILEMVLIPPIAAAIDAGFSLGVLTYVSKNPEQFIAKRSQFWLAGSIWAALCSVLYFSTIDIAKCMFAYGFDTNCATSPKGADFDGIAIAATAVCVLGIAAQRALIGLNYTRRQAVGATLVFILSGAVWIASKENLYVVTCFIVIGLPTIDISLLLLLPKKRGDISLESPTPISQIALHAVLFGYLQIVSLVAYLSDTRLLADIQPNFFVAEYGFIQRVTLLVLTTYSLLILPKWRSIGSAASVKQANTEALSNKDLIEAFQLASMLSVAYACALSIYLFWFDLGKFSEIDKWWAIIGFALQVFVGIVSATIGIHFAFSEKRYVVILPVAGCILLLIFTKPLFLADSPMLMPTYASLIVFLLSVLPQILACKAGRKHGVRNEKI